MTKTSLLNGETVYKQTEIHLKTVAFHKKIMYNNKAARRWGGSGTLHLQSAIAELNAFLDDVYGRFARRKEC